jgi:hypothetical protein
MKVRVVLGLVLVAGLTVPWADAQVPAGGEFRVNTYTTSLQARPSIATAPAGDFVVVWESFLQDGSEFGVFAQRFDAAGVRLGAEVQVNVETANRQYTLSVAIAPAGDFVVAWMGA